MTKPIHITGRLKDTARGAPVAALRVEAWDKDLLVSDFAGETLSDAQGVFHLEIDAARFQELFLDRAPDLFFKVYRGDELLCSTEDAVLWNARDPVEVVIEISGKRPEPTEFVVHGEVRGGEGEPLANANVQAVHRLLRGERPLGEAKTDAAGRYRIRYSASDISRVNLIVRASTASGTAVAESPPRYGAAANEEVSLIAAGLRWQGPSRFEQLSTALAPHLAGLRPAELTRADAEFLAAQAAADPADILRYSEAARAEAATKLPASVLFGLFSMGLPSSVPALLAVDPRIQRHTLEEAFAENLIPLRFAKEKEALLERLRGLIVERAFERDGAGASLADILGTAVPQRARQEEFFRRFAAHRGAPAEFWDALRNDPEFGPKQAEAAELSFRLGGLTHGHLPLIRALQARFAEGGVRDLRDLARWDKSEWKRQLDGSGLAAIGTPPGVPGDTPERRLDAYAGALTAFLADAFPTTAVAARLARDGELFRGREASVEFLNQNPDFELGGVPAKVYAERNPTSVDGVNDRDALLREMSRLQRVFRIAPRWEWVRPLLLAGIGSARDVVALGRAKFLQTYEPIVGEAPAALIYEHAEARTAIATNLVLNLATELQVPIAVLPAGLRDVAGVPNLETLFGPVGFCSCEHCRSVLSPAAYFVDILHFLEQRLPAVTNAASPKAVLFARRADLGQIELTCENANRRLPYVDLVNELLEELVAPGSARAIAPRDRQTSASDAELAANPEHTDGDAYDALRAEVFPWGLPFDLWVAETRAYLAHLGVPRHELMTALGRPDAAIAAEALGLTGVESRIVTGRYAELTPPRSAPAFWGYSGSGFGGDANLLARLLRVSGLSRSELEEVRRTRFVDPEGVTSIEPIDPADLHSCDPEKLELRAPAAARDGILDRLHRFVRLERKLGTTSAELDESLALLPARSDPDDLLRGLSGLRRLAAELRLPTDVLLSFWAPLDPARPSSLYQRLFQNPTVVNPVDEAFSAPSGGPLASHAPTLQAALGLSAADLDALIAAVTDGTLTVENLSALHRHAALARALRLSVAELLQLKIETSLDPFQSVADTLRFVEIAGKLRERIVSVQDLASLRRAPDDPAATERRARLLEQLRSDLGAIRSLDLIASTLLGALALDGALGDAVDAWIRLHPAATELLSDAFVTSTAPVTPDAHPSLFALLARLEWTLVLSARFDAAREPWAWVFWLDELPDGAGALIAFASCERFFDRLRLRTIIPGRAATLDATLVLARTPGVERERLLTTLAEHTGFAVDDLRVLDGAEGLAHDSSQWRDGSALVRLHAATAAIGRLGAAVPQVLAWCGDVLSQEDASAARRAAAAKYTAEAWLEIAKPLRDVLREQQRAALVDYLVQRPGLGPDGAALWRDVASLYNYLLIDVEMSPCMMTSRLKQAAASVQLFVQRCLMNLEWPDVEADSTRDDGWLEWEWMKTYRVWEANRKVFLWPENLLDTDFLREKSGIFREIESELFQNEVTLETAEPAFTRYLERLSEVARLEVVAVYQEVEGDADHDVVHVIGRTQGDPRVHYYRRRVNGRWTPWERIDVDIEGEHLLLVAWQRRLILFWATLEEKSEDRPLRMPAPNIELEPAPKHWELRLTWSERHHDRWMPKKRAREVATVSSDEIWFSARTPQEHFALKPVFDGEELSVRVYFFSGGPLLNGDSGSRSNLQHWPLTDLKVSPCDGNVRLDALSPRDRGALTYIALPHYAHVADSQFRGNETRSFLDAVQVLASELPVDAGEAAAASEVRVPLISPPRRFAFAPSWQDLQFTGQRPFVYQDEKRAFLVQPIWEPWVIGWRFGTEFLELQNNLVEDYWVGANDRLALSGIDVNNRAAPAGIVPARADDVETPTVAPNAPPVFRVLNPLRAASKRYRFETFYHPYTCLFLRELRRGGIPALFARELQTAPEELVSEPLDFEDVYLPEAIVDTNYPEELVDFSRAGAFSQYNWELFFHVPILIADRLRQNQRFAEAQRWYHFVFDPTDTSAHPKPSRYWRMGHFFQTTAETYERERIENLLRQLAERRPDAELSLQVDEWRANPFDPHLVARLRTTAYQRSVVMKYIDNLIEWGDQLFGRATLESINEATQLYVLAAEILGPRPPIAAPRTAPVTRTYDELAPILDEFSNAALDDAELLTVDGERLPSTPPGTPRVTLPPLLYFCIPPNEKLLAYWDKVADRLFKIRHCRDIAGGALSLPLYEPPIDPALLVRARMAGVDLEQVLSEVHAPLPRYRYAVLVQKAKELLQEVRGLGQSLLAALEKRDVEELTLLRSDDGIRLLEAAGRVRDHQVDEAAKSLESLERSLEQAELRRDYYASRPFMNTHESSQIAQSQAALILQQVSAGLDLVANVVALIPNFKLAAPTSAGATFGGDNVASALKAYASYIGAGASIAHASGGLSSTLGSYERRMDEWRQLESQAAKDIQQLQAHIRAAEIRLAIAEEERQNHELELEQTREADAFMRGKYTSRELYSWMTSQLSTLYFQSFQLAYGIAKRAERAWQHEIGDDETTFVRPGHWDSLKKGLLAADRVLHDLARMEVAYLERNAREYELTKHVSLALTSSEELDRLKNTGRCSITLSESLLDGDFPAHFMRRLKSVSLTVPAVVGPYSGVHGILTLERHQTRRSAGRSAPLDWVSDGSRSIATSHAVNDSGLFELSFRDERYLPFEGLGAISEWTLELDAASNTFDLASLTDVVLHVAYTARRPT